jgi:hypothetical protein
VVNPTAENANPKSFFFSFSCSFVVATYFATLVFSTQIFHDWASGPSFLFFFSMDFLTNSATTTND